VRRRAVSGEHRAAAGDLDITSSLTIAGARATIDGRGLGRGFDVVKSCGNSLPAHGD